MHLSMLQAMGQQAEQLKNRRAEGAEDFFQQGIHWLQRAETEGFTQSEALPEACKALIQAIKSQRTDPRPYLALAYIYLILGDLNSALDYVRPVLEQEATHPVALELKQQIQAETEAQLQQRRAPAATPSGPALRGLNEMGALQDLADADLDLVYEQLRQALYGLVKEVMELPFPELAVTPAALKDLQALQHTFTQRVGHLHSQIEALDEEMEVQDLRLLTRPLQTQSRRLEQLILSSQSAIDLLEQITADQELVVQVIQETQQTQDPEDIPVLEENIDALFDNLAAYQRQLDSLKQAKLAVAALETAFSQLSDLIQTLEDRVDDAVERLQALTRQPLLPV